jgi:hypothetical protein
MLPRRRCFNVRFAERMDSIGSQVKTSMKSRALPFLLGVMLALAHMASLASVTTNGDVHECSVDRSLYVGESFPGALLQVDGGSTLSLPADLGEGVFPSSSNNLVLVKDPGTFLIVAQSGVSVGETGSGNRLELRSRAQIQSQGVSIGSCGAVIGDCESYFGMATSGSSTSNSVLITDLGTLWSVQGEFNIGGDGSIYAPGNSLTVNNGAHLSSTSGRIEYACYGSVAGAGSRWDVTGPMDVSGQLALNGGAQMTCQTASFTGGSLFTVSGPGSSLSATQDLQVGYVQDQRCSVNIANGAHGLVLGNIFIGSGFRDAQNVVLVSGSDSRLVCPTNTIVVGTSSDGGGNQLGIMAGSLAVAANINIGAGNSAIVAGTLFITNSDSSGTLTLSGSLTNSGAIVADQIVCNGGLISFLKNTIMTKAAAITNGQPFVVGDATSLATYVMQGGIHSFNNGLVIATNSVLSGCGTVNGAVTNYGTILITNGCDMDFNSVVVNYGTIVAASGTPHFHVGLLDRRLPAVRPQVIYSDNFDANSSANWIVHQSSPDTRVTFNYDYSADGIPSAPNSVGGTTRGVKFEANMTSGIVAALSISPAGQIFSGNYRLHFDLWMNVNMCCIGSTEFFTAGVGTSGNQVQWTGAGNTADGCWFSLDGEGGVADTTTTTGDFVAYTNNTVLAVTSGVYASGTNSNARGNGNPYYQGAFPGDLAPPSSQTQGGTLPAGTPGFAWHDVVISKIGDAVTWQIDGLMIATLTNVTVTDGNIFIGYWDPFASVSDHAQFSFDLVDNVRVEKWASSPVSILTSGGGFGFSSGHFGFTMAGPVGTTVVVDRSTDLKDWTPAMTNILTTGTTPFSDSNSGKQGARFYRARVQ